jgi:hypothetical protein
LTTLREVTASPQHFSLHTHNYTKRDFETAQNRSVKPGWNERQPRLENLFDMMGCAESGVYVDGDAQNHLWGLS